MFFFYDPTLWLITWVLLLLGSIATLVFYILSLVAAMNCLEQCSRRRRKMEPGQVWFALIPAFGAVWIYFVVLQLEESLQREYKSRGLRRPKSFGQPLGLAAVICWQAGSLLVCIAIGALGIIAAGGLFIPYWMALSKHHKQLLRTRRVDVYDDEDDEDEDDRPRRRSRRDRDDDDEDDRPPRRRSRRDEEAEDDDEDRPKPERPKRPPPKPESGGDWKR